MGARKGTHMGAPNGVPIEAHEVWPMGAHGANTKKINSEVYTGSGNLAIKSPAQNDLDRDNFGQN